MLGRDLPTTVRKRQLAGEWGGGREGAKPYAATKPGPI
jgi:hypothetical protein